MCSGMQGNNGLSVKTLCISGNSSLPCPPPPWANAAHLPTLEVHGVWGICKLCMHFFIAYQTFLWKWRNDRRSERNLCKLRKEALKKIQDFNGVWTRDLAIQVRYSTNWAMKPLLLGAGQLWVHRFLWKKWVFMIYEKLYMNCGNEMKMKWTWNENEMVVPVNAIYAIA